MHQYGILEGVHGRGEEAVGPRDLVTGFKSLAKAVEGRREGRVSLLEQGEGDDGQARNVRLGLGCRIERSTCKAGVNIKTLPCCSLQGLPRTFSCALPG